MFSTTQFRVTFKLLQALAYAPEADVVEGFESIINKYEHTQLEEKFLKYILKELYR